MASPSTCVYREGAPSSAHIRRSGLKPSYANVVYAWGGGGGGGYHPPYHFISMSANMLYMLTGKYVKSREGDSGEQICATLNLRGAGVELSFFAC